MAETTQIDLQALRTMLLDPKQFSELAAVFIDGAVEQAESQSFKRYYKAALEAITEENAEEVAALAGSPIEKTFLNSLLLSFIKNDGLGLLVHPTYKDTRAEIADFRLIHRNWKEFCAWRKENRPADESLEEFFDGEVQRGAMDPEERAASVRLVFRYGYVPLDDSYHMTLQPRFPDIKIDGKSIRADIYFWKPSRPDINIVVECDGFDYHSDRSKFTTDRQRDRALKARGYEVLRFSGSEIYKDPVNVAHELARYLWDRAKAPSVQ